MLKLDYITSQISKTNNKKFENYVVSRIWHGLNSLDYKIVTQQYVKRPEKKYALTDMYFPQLGIHIEIDEAHHKADIINDKIREYDIINITNHKVYRIDVTKSIAEVNDYVDTIIKAIIDRRQELGSNFKVWDPEKEISTQTYIDKGYIDMKDNVAFKNIVDAVNCFGFNHIGYQRGGIKHPIETEKYIWFPKLYPNNLWINSISDDELTICEEANEKESDKHITKDHIIGIINEGFTTRIVFARIKDSLGSVMYKFKGVFELEKENSILENKLIWKRIATRVKTYKQPIKKTYKGDVYK